MKEKERQEAINKDGRSYVGFEVLSAVTMKIYFFWDIMTYSPLKFN
jgi:hypothetical protein